MTGKLLLASILCLMGGSALGIDILEGNYNVTACCTAVKTGTQLGSIESCQKYYVCQSTGPVVAECQSGYSYDYKKGNCYPSSQVNCYWGVSEPCAGRDKVWVPNTDVCGGYYYCNNGTGQAGNCPANQLFDGTTQSCYWGKCSSTLDSSNGTTLGSLCDVVPPGEFFGDTEKCDTWHYCDNSGTGVILNSGVCNTTNNQTAYNVKTGTCDYASSSVCSRVTDVPLSNAAVSCPTAGATKPDDNVCGTYSVCTNGAWVSTDCATGYYFNVSNSVCVPRQAATPIAGCNRCEDSKTMFVNAVDSNNCSNYYYCDSKGVNTLIACPTDYFFNEQIQGCSANTGLAAYVPNNGACRGATAAGSNSTTTEAPESSTVDGKMFEMFEE